MGYSLQIDMEEPQDLASVTGLGDLRQWAESLDAKSCPNLRHLLEHGWEEDLDGLETELTDLLKSDPPARTGVEETAGNLLSLLKGRPDGATVVSVTDGLGE